VLQSKVAAKPWSLRARERHRQRLPLRVSLVLVHSEDSLPRRHRLGRLRVAREAGNNLSNQFATNLQPRRPGAQVRMKREVQERNKARFVNLGNPGEVHRLQLSSEGRQSRNKERKRARGPRSQDHNSKSRRWLQR
jgi:hypothetical protein